MGLIKDRKWETQDDGSVLVTDIAVPGLNDLKPADLKISIGPVIAGKRGPYRMVFAEAFSHKRLSDGRKFTSTAVGILSTRTMPDQRQIVALDPLTERRGSAPATAGAEAAPAAPAAAPAG